MAALTPPDTRSYPLVAFVDITFDDLVGSAVDVAAGARRLSQAGGAVRVLEEWPARSNRFGCRDVKLHPVGPTPKIIVFDEIG